MNKIRCKHSPIASRKATRRPVRRRVVFRCQALPGSEVGLAGSFNAWQHDRHRMRQIPENGEYLATLILPPGRHEYKFVVNGEWCIDPNAKDWAPNPHGTLNSVVVVGEP